MVAFWAWEDEAAWRLRARVFPNGIGIDEDEATGAAAIQFGALLGRPLVFREGPGLAALRPARRRRDRRRRRRRPDGRARRRGPESGAAPVAMPLWRPRHAAARVGPPSCSSRSAACRSSGTSRRSSRARASERAVLLTGWRAARRGVRDDSPSGRRRRPSSASTPGRTRHRRPHAHRGRRPARRGAVLPRPTAETASPTSTSGHSARSTRRRGRSRR